MEASPGLVTAVSVTPRLSRDSLTCRILRRPGPAAPGARDRAAAGAAGVAAPAALRRATGSLSLSPRPGSG